MEENEGTLSDIDLLSSDQIPFNNQKYDQFSKSFESNISAIEDVEHPPTPSQQNEHFFPGEKKKRNKEDLNKTPLPIFSCIYCSNEPISFGHLSRTIISEKYLINESVYDAALITKYITKDYTINDQNCMSIQLIVQENFEFLQKFYQKNQTLELFKSKINEIQSNYLYTSSLLKRVIQNINKKTEKKSININTRNNNHLNVISDIIPATNNNSSSLNFNSVSLGVNAALRQLNSIGLDSIVENMVNSEDDNDQEDFFNFLKFDLRRKISRNDINWDPKSFSIWDPEFDDDDTDKEEEKEYISTNNNNILSNNKKSLLSLSSFSSSLLYNSNNLVSELSNVSVPKPRVYISSYTKAKAPSKQSTQCESKICGSKETSFNLNSLLSFTSSSHNENLHYKKISAGSFKEKGRISFNKKAQEILDLINSREDEEKREIGHTKRRVNSIISYKKNFVSRGSHLRKK